jgi:hypothetical protein
MSHIWIVTLNLVSISAWMVSSFCLYWASLTIPWKNRSYGGETPIEKKYERTQWIMASIGLPCVVIASGCEAVAVLWS